ncbi:MAG: formylglycine-generating enzyme family protein [Candidatus Eremiobacteraeota bacterium]|nr:formylglycine-generating enzyme family protein [Candidatus Eremiobacteraeota bacterium]
MRALEQIALHLRNRRLLSFDEIRELLRLGLLPPLPPEETDELCDHRAGLRHQAREAQLTTQEQQAEHLDNLSDQLSAAPQKKQRGRRGAQNVKGDKPQRANTQTIQKISDQLSRSSRDHSHVSPLVMLARQFAPCHSANEAIQVLLRQNQDSLRTLVDRTLSSEEWPGNDPAERPRDLRGWFSSKAAEQAQRKWARHLGLNNHVIVSPTTQMQLALIPPGAFQMGALDSEKPAACDDEFPRHWVRISQPFFMGVVPVTQREFEQICGDNPSLRKREYWPVNQVSWHRAQEFCSELSRRDRRTYRLPTEAEWEYACRAGTTTPFTFGLTLSSDVANYQADHVYGMGGKGVYRLTPIDVGSLGAANAFGLYDVHGNVWEWCDDFYAEYPSAPQFDPLGPMNGTLRVMRGGGWESIPSKCRSGARVAANEDFRRSDLGFRIVLPEMVYSERP